jgi:hypothetical protein
MQTDMFICDDKKTIRNGIISVTITIALEQCFIVLQTLKQKSFHEFLGHQYTVFPEMDIRGEGDWNFSRNGYQAQKPSIITSSSGLYCASIRLTKNVRTLL